MAGPFLSLNEWNDIIDRVNQLAQNPDDGCDPVSTLEPLSDPAFWSADNVEDVRNKLKEICADNNFNAELTWWTQQIIDEIEDAISNGWCDCDGCPPVSEEIILLEYEQPVVRRDFECVGGPPVGTLGVPTHGDGPPPPSEMYDFLAAASGITGNPQQQGGLSIIYKQLDPDGNVMIIKGIGSAQFNCDGSLKNLQRAGTLPPVGESEVDFKSHRAYDTYCWTMAGEISCPFAFFVFIYYTVCEGCTCEDGSCAKYLKQTVAFGVGGPVAPEPDWACGSSAVAAKRVEQDAAADAGGGYKQIWYAIKTQFAGCQECAENGTDFA